MNEYLLILSLEIDREAGRIMPCLHTIEAKKTLEELWRIISCDLVTCTEIEVDGKQYDIWSDDEGLMVDKPVPTLYVNDDLILFGNVVFATNSEGATTGLEQEDVLALLKYVSLQAPKLYRWIERYREKSIANATMAG